MVAFLIEPRRLDSNTSFFSGIPLVKPILSILLLMSLSAAPWAAEPEMLGDQIVRLAQQHHFSLRGAELTQETPARPMGGGDLKQQLKQLLTGFSYMFIAPPETGPQRLIIMGENQPLPPLKQGIAIVVPTQRKGAHHLVEAILRGTHGMELRQQLMVDTGATYVVLALSQADALGMDLQTMEEKTIQTAKGQVQARVGQLPALRLGAEEVFDVDVAFIDDQFLGAQSLLGMSVLNRYRVTLDDQENTLTLSGKDSEE